MSHRSASRRFIATLASQPRCQWCRHVVYAYENHCAKCGKKNDAFVHKEFVAERGETLASALARCQKSHVRDITILSVLRVDRLDYAYCEDCGTYFLRYRAN